MSSAVSERNLAVARELFRTLNEEGSAAVLDRVDEFSDPEIEWRGVAVGRDAPGGDVVYRGYDGQRRFWEEIEELFERIHFSNLRFEALSEDVVLVLAEVSGIGRGSGIAISLEMGTVYRFRDGRILLGENFPSHAEAIESAHRAAVATD